MPSEQAVEQTGDWYARTFSTVKTPPSFRAWADSVLPVLVWAVKVATVSAVYSLGVTLAVRYHTAFSRS